MPASTPPGRYAAWFDERREARGTLPGCDVPGTALQEGRHVTAVRSRSSVAPPTACSCCDPEAETRLQRVSFRGLQVALPFLPTGPGRFASWDGGFSSSRIAEFARGEEGRARVTLLQGTSAITAAR